MMRATRMLLQQKKRIIGLFLKKTSRGSAQLSWTVHSFGRTSARSLLRTMIARNLIASALTARLGALLTGVRAEALMIGFRRSAQRKGRASWTSRRTAAARAAVGGRSRANQHS